MEDEPSIKIGYRANARNKSVSAESAAKSKLSGGSVETNRKLAGNSTTGKAADGQKMGMFARTGSAFGCSLDATIAAKLDREKYVDNMKNDTMWTSMGANCRLLGGQTAR